MAESYPNADENRAPDSVRGVARPFADFGYADFQRAFDAVVGAKPERSEGETALIRRAEKFCRVLVKFPGIRRIWVCNSLSMNAADGDSDIDLFVETAPGMLWTGRVMTTLFFSLLGARRHGNYVKGRFCLSFFAVENADLGKVAVADDAYLYEWVRRLVRVDGKDAGKRLPENPKRPSALTRAVETVFKALFLPKTLREYERLGKPWGIVISDEFLKFHPEDRRIEIRDRVRKELEGKRE
ncbi:MAG: hypothetical protein WA194_06335 [Patescibacteria group bacterium]